MPNNNHDDIFVLVLQLDQYQNTNLPSQLLCGRTITQWLENAVAPWHHRFINTAEQDDIVTLFKNNITSAKYTVIVYGDLPLLTTDSIHQAVDYCTHKNIQALRLPRGWVFDTQVVASSNSFKVDEFLPADPTDYLVAFNDQQLAKIRTIMQERINQEHIRNGVAIIDPSHTYIDATVKIAPNCVIEPNVHLMGNTTIATKTTILNGSRINDSAVGQNCQIGPYAHLRPNTSIGNNCRIGNFVEIKRSRVGNGSKIAHMTYVGDSTIGQNCNIGCGVIFCNYNGKTKAGCILGNHVFIGSNTCLVAPLEVGDHAYIAAGSVITEKLPERALGIARARQAIKENYVTE